MKWSDIFHSPDNIGEYGAIHDCAKNAVDSMRYEEACLDADERAAQYGKSELPALPDASSELSEDEIRHIAHVLDVFIEMAHAIKKKMEKPSEIKAINDMLNRIPKRTK